MKLMKSIASKPSEFFSKKQGLSSVKMIQLILASSCVPTTSNALSPDFCDIAAVAEPGMASISWSIFNGSYIIDVIYMQLCFFLEELYVHIFYGWCLDEAFHHCLCFHASGGIRGRMGFHHCAHNLSFVQNGLRDRGH